MRNLCRKMICNHKVALLVMLAIAILGVSAVICMDNVAYAEDTNSGIFLEGSGTETEPYIIETKQQLNAVRNDLTASYRLNADIEFTEADFAEGGEFYNDGKGWEPIGTSNPFCGTFDGNGHVIKKIVMKYSYTTVGVFGICNNAKIMNLGIVEGNISNSGYMGAIVGQMTSGEISNCYNAGEIIGRTAGGIVGQLATGEVSNCYNAGKISGDVAGGIVGQLRSGEVSNCYNIGAVSAIGSRNIVQGEIIGKCLEGTVTNCYYIEDKLLGVGEGEDGATACSPEKLEQQDTYKGFDFETVWMIDTDGNYKLPTLRGVPNYAVSRIVENTTDFAGGYGVKSSPYIIANAQQLNNVRKYLGSTYKMANDIIFTLADFEADGEFHNNGKGWEPIGDDASKFTGVFDGNGHIIKGLRSNQDEVSDDEAGYAGLFGSSSGIIKRVGIIECKIKGSTSVGSICAENEGTIFECYNAGTVASTGYAGVCGGIVGRNNGIIHDCYNAGIIESNYYGGGIVGINYKYNSKGSIANCYDAGSVKCKNRGCLVSDNCDSENIVNSYHTKRIANALESGGDSRAISLEELRKKETYAGFDFENVWTIEPQAEYWMPTLRNVANYATGFEENTTDFAGGYGTYDSPYIVKTKEQLNNIRNYLYASYRLENDIIFTTADFSKKGAFYNEGKRWEPIGSKEDPFVGNLDGNGHSIKGLIIDRSDEYACGLFSYTYGEIKGLGISNFRISGIYWGSITANNYGIIRDCFNTGSVQLIEPTGNQRSLVCGLFCYENNGTVIACYNIGDIQAASYYGVGAIAYINNSNGIIEQCYNAGNIVTNGSAAGIAIENNGIIRDSYNAGNIEAEGFVGGIATKSNYYEDYSGYRGTISKCYNTGIIKTRTHYYSEDARKLYAAGAIVGNCYNGIKISDCYYLDSSSEYDENLEYGKICSLRKMKDKDTYKGFDFADVWEIQEGGTYTFPTLKSVRNYAVEPQENTTDFEGGYGTKSSPYIIKNKTQLNNVRKRLNACYKLSADISFSVADFASGGVFYNDGKGWEPIGDTSHVFTGTFNGAGYSITGLTINRSTEENIGLFGVSCGTVKNLNMVGSSIKGKTKVGGIVGYNSTGKIQRCTSKGEITALVSTENEYDNYAYAGGIVGYSYAGEISECSNGADVQTGHCESFGYAGGITGFHGTEWGESYSEISKCHNYGKITDLDINNSNNSSVGIGGISGDNRGTINMCYNTGEVLCMNSVYGSAGGIAGDNFHGKILNSYNLGNISSRWNAGGILGENSESGEINSCYNAGKVETTWVKRYEDDDYRQSYAGGIVGNVGYSLNKLEKCYNLGTIISNYGTIGGIVGRIADNDPTFSTCYNVGNLVCEAGIAGGIAGESSATISDCFYLDNISKGVGNGTDAATQCSVIQMQKQETYGDAFDFDYDMIWDISETTDYKFPVLTEIVNPELQYALSLETKQGVPDAPTAASYGNGKITVNTVYGQRYVCVCIDENNESGKIPPVNSSEWKTATGLHITFDNLEQGKTYRIYTYIPAKESQNASYVSQPLTVTLKAVGDLNGDSKIDIADTLYLKRALAGWTGYDLNFSAADINEDGVIDQADLMVLERYLAGWAGYETLPVTTEQKGV